MMVYFLAFLSIYVTMEVDNSGAIAIIQEAYNVSSKDGFCMPDDDEAAFSGTPRVGTYVE